MTIPHGLYRLGSDLVDVTTHHSEPGTVHTYPAVTIPHSLYGLGSDLLDVATLYQVLYIHILL